jgi:hypothetical protein
MKGGVDVDVEEVERKEGSRERNAPKSQKGRARDHHSRHYVVVRTFGFQQHVCSR